MNRFVPDTGNAKCVSTPFTGIEPSLRPRSGAAEAVSSAGACANFREFNIASKQEASSVNRSQADADNCAHRRNRSQFLDVIALSGFK